MKYFSLFVIGVALLISAQSEAKSGQAIPRNCPLNQLLPIKEQLTKEKKLWEKQIEMGQNILDDRVAILFTDSALLKIDYCTKEITRRQFCARALHLVNRFRGLLEEYSIADWHAYGMSLSEHVLQFQTALYYPMQNTCR